MDKVYGPVRALCSGEVPREFQGNRVNPPANGRVFVRDHGLVRFCSFWAETVFSPDGELAKRQFSIPCFCM